MTPASSKPKKVVKPKKKKVETEPVVSSPLKEVESAETALTPVVKKVSKRNNVRINTAV